MKLMVCPKGKDITSSWKLGVTSYLVGLKGFSTNCDCSVTVEEIHSMIEKYPNIELFILINKNIFNHELETIEQELKRLEKESVKGIFFYDQAILSIHQRFGLKHPLVWNQTHMVTNYNTCNYYLEQGVEYGLVAGEITLDEILEMKKKTKMKLIVPILGYAIMSHSNRKLLSNYFQFIGKEKKKKQYSLTEANQEHSYFVEEDQTGTSFYEGVLLNGTEALFSLLEQRIPYVLIYEKGIENKVLEGIIPLYLELIQKGLLTEEEKEAYLCQSKKILNSNHTGFFFKKTIYKVKKNG